MNAYDRFRSIRCCVFAEAQPGTAFVLGHELDTSGFERQYERLSLLDGKIRAHTVRSQWKSTAPSCSPSNTFHDHGRIGDVRETGENKYRFDQI